MIRDGLLPYKDFFCPYPPLYILKELAIMSVFGDSLLAFRASGIIERLLLAVAVYWWVVRQYSKESAFVAAATTVILSSLDGADTIDWYSFGAILCACIASILISYAMDAPRTTKQIAGLALGSGLFAAFSVFTKQTIGIGASGAIGIGAAWCFFRMRGARSALTFLASFCSGWIAGTGLCTGWLLSHGVLMDFFQNAFVQGPAAKAAHPTDYAQRFINRILVGSWFSVIAVIWLIASWRPLRRFQAPEKTAQGWKTLVILCACGLLSVGVGAVLGQDTESGGAKLVMLLVLAFMFIFMFLTLYGSAALLLSLGWSSLRGKMSWREAQLFIFAAVSASVCVMVSLSAPLYPPVMMPGLAMFLAPLIDSKRAVIRFSIMSLCMVLITGSVTYKLLRPFGFEDFDEPPASTATKASTLPQLRGCLLPPITAEFVDETVHIVQKYTTPKDTIFVYPEGAIFYWLTERRCTTFSLMHNMDTTNDELAKNESERLIKNEPAVIVYYRSRESVMKALERLWRGGRVSGNRQIMQTLDNLVQHYKLMKTFTFPASSTEGDVSVMVYLRPDKLQAGDSK
jgi:hypothetical protein